MKTRGLAILIALGFLVLSCAAAAPKPSSQGSAFPTTDTGFSTNYSEDPYAIPVEASAIEGIIEKLHYGLPASRGSLLSAVDLSAM